MLEQAQKIVDYKKGEIVKYKGYEDDLVNHPYLEPTPNKYFRIINADMSWGVVYYRINKTKTNSVGIAHIQKTNFMEKILWFLFW